MRAGRRSRRSGSLRFPAIAARIAELPAQEVADWPAWFGVRLAHLTTTVDQWGGELFDSDGLQAWLHQELLMSDAGEPEGGSTAAALSRREALAALAALPLAPCTSIQQGFTSGATTEVFLARCAAGITACWHLLRGSDLDTVVRMLSGYLLTLDALARQQSRYQQVAARLASQAHRVAGIVALHRGNLRTRERHCQQALSYARLAADPIAEVSARACWRTRTIASEICHALRKPMKGRWLMNSRRLCSGSV